MCYASHCNNNVINSYWEIFHHNLISIVFTCNAYSYCLVALGTRLVQSVDQTLSLTCSGVGLAM